MEKNDVNPSSSYDGTIAGEVGAAFSAMVAGRKNRFPVGTEE